MPTIVTKGLPTADGVVEPETTFHFDITRYDERHVVAIPCVREDRTSYIPLHWSQDAWLEATGLLDGPTGIELSYYLRDADVAAALVALLMPLAVEESAPDAPVDGLG
jgi:hypothetical protein